MDQAEDLNEFIELANLVRSVDAKSLNGFRAQLYTAFFKFANRPKILNDVKALKNANALHSKILDEYLSASYVSDKTKDYK